MLKVCGSKIDKRVNADAIMIGRNYAKGVIWVKSGTLQEKKPDPLQADRVSVFRSQSKNNRNLYS